jgi:hypothetical protein
MGLLSVLGAMLGALRMACNIIEFWFFCFVFCFLRESCIHMQPRLALS